MQTGCPVRSGFDMFILRSLCDRERRVTDSAGVRASFPVRTAWRWLMAPVLIVVLFGIGDVALGNAADPAIVEGLTGVTFEEIEAVSPEAATVIDLQARGIGYLLIWMGTALAAVLLFGFRRWHRWAWFAMWVLPLWSITTSVNMFLVDRPDAAPIPPPMVSGLVFFAYAAFWLAVSYKGFTGISDRPL